MLRVTTAAILGMALTMNGCNKETEKANDPSQPAPPENSAAAENTFSLTMPEDGTNLPTNGSVKVDIGVNRDGEFKDAVSLKLTAPENITIEPASPTIPADQDHVEVTLKAGANTAPGMKSIMVEGTAGEKKADGELKVEVVAEDDGNAPE